MKKGWAQGLLIDEEPARERALAAFWREDFEQAGILMRTIALISEHASPLAAPGGVDSGGQNVYVAHLAQQLAQAGHRVDVFTRRESPSQVPVVAWQPNVRVVHVPAGPARVLPKEAVLPCMPAFGDCMLAFMRRQTWSYDLVHANFFMSGMAAKQIKQALGIPFVITFHALGHVRRLAQGEADAFPAARTRIEAALMQEAARVIAECPQDRQDMETLYGAPSARIEIVPCGFDPDEMWRVSGVARRQIGLEEDGFTVLQLGRMVPRKGVDNAIRSIALLRERHGIAARLLVVGGNAPTLEADWTAETQRLRALTAELGLSRQVHFTGQRARDQLRYYYSAADVFVTTPWYEPFGITPVEAMACGTPVVGSAVGGIKSTVVDGQTGFLVPPKNPEALADKLAILYRQPELAQKMGAAGMRRAWRDYTWEGVARQIAAIYENVLDTNAAPFTGDFLPPARPRFSATEWTV